jgi:hypothetical protein
MLVAFTLILGFVFLDNAHRRELETTSETTSVGDTHFFEPPTDASRLPVVGATLNGQALYVAGVESIEIRDTHTHRAGADAERGMAIYELAASATDAERARLAPGRRTFLLKTAVNRYVAARPADGK